MVDIRHLLEVVKLFGKVSKCVIPPIHVLRQIRYGLVMIRPEPLELVVGVLCRHLHFPDFIHMLLIIQVCLPVRIIALHPELIYLGLQLDDLLLKLLMCVGIPFLQRLHLQCLELLLLQQGLVFRMDLLLELALRLLHVRDLGVRVSQLVAQIRDL